MNQSDILFDPPPRIMKIKIKQCDLIKLKRFCAAKETIKNWKDNPQNGRKIFAKWPIYLYINLQNIQISHAAWYIQKKKPIKKWAEDLKRCSSKEERQMAKKHMQRCSTSLIIREMQVKTTRYHLPSVRMAIRKSVQTMLERMWRKGNSPTLLVGV